MMIDGEWHEQPPSKSENDGRFKRQDSSFRDWISADGSTDFPAEAGRYHLYVSYACPWAHRTLILRELKRLKSVVSTTSVDPLMLDGGWKFSDQDGCGPDPILGAQYLREIYAAAIPDYTGKVTVPVLWDKKTGTIVNNESSEILRMLDSEFQDLGANPTRFSPEELRDEIDVINADVYTNINNGVYKCGFASTQEAYEEAFDALFEALDRVESRLADNRYLLGDRITEADWRLFTTLVRFDSVYYVHFKCNLRRIAEYPNLSGYLRELYQIPGVESTVRFDHIKNHYYRSHPSLNPKQIVARGPKLDLETPHSRDPI